MLPGYIRFLIEAGHKAPSADNSQPWEFTWNGEEIGIKIAQNRCNRTIFGEGHPAIALTLGAVVENIQQAASAAGIDFKWHFESSDGAADPTAIHIKHIVSPSTTLPDLQTQGLCTRHTNRHPFKTEVLPANLVNDLRSMSDDGAALEVFDRRPQIRELAGLVNAASKIRFQIKELHEWLASSLRFTPEQVDQGDGLDVATIHLPPGGALLLKATREWRRMAFLNKLGAYQLFAAIEAGLFQKAGAIIAVLMPRDKHNTLAAGRLMERAWIKLNKNGISVQPYFVLTDQLYRLSQGDIPPSLVNECKELSLATKDLFSSHEEGEIAMLLRVGYPTKNPVLSRRLDWRSIVSVSE